MSLYDDMSRDFLSVWEEVPAFLILGDEKIRAIISQDTASADLELGGFATRNTMSARLLREEFSSQLKIGVVVQVEGNSYRVEKIQTRPTTPIVTLDLIEYP